MKRWGRILLVSLGAIAIVASVGMPAYAESRIGSVVVKSDTTNYQVIARHSSKCLDLDGGRAEDGTAIIQWGCHGGLNQRWQLQLKFGGAVGTYLVVAAPTGKCMAVLDGSKDDGADVVEMPCAVRRDRLWRISEVSEGYLHFVSVVSGKCLDVRDVGFQDGARIQQWSCHDGGNQQWRIRE
jgi:hypothetical protein